MGIVPAMFKNYEFGVPMAMQWTRKQQREREALLALADQLLGRSKVKRQEKRIRKQRKFAVSENSLVTPATPQQMMVIEQRAKMLHRNFTVRSKGSHTTTCRDGKCSHPACMCV